MQTADSYISKELANFLAVAVIITLVMLLDDLFLFHELVFPIFLNIPGRFLFISYAIIILWYLLRFRRTIVNTKWAFLFLGFLCFGSSIFIDILRDIFHLDFYQPHLLEDGFKLLGIVSWLSYYVTGSFNILFQIICQTNQVNINYPKSLVEKV